ncbi:MAG: hypothetical protein ABEI06_07870, partial [Halobacteriaceae archaeon]
HTLERAVGFLCAGLLEITAALLELMVPVLEVVFDSVLGGLLIVVVGPAVVAGFGGAVFVLDDRFKKWVPVGVGDVEFDRQRAAPFQTGFSGFYVLIVFYYLGVGCVWKGITVEEFNTPSLATALRERLATCCVARCGRGLCAILC